MNWFMLALAVIGIFSIMMSLYTLISWFISVESSLDTICDVVVELSDDVEPIPLTYAEFRIENALVFQNEKRDRHDNRSIEQIYLRRYFGYLNICNPKKYEKIITELEKRFYKVINEGIYWKGDFKKDDMFCKETHDNIIELVDNFIKEFGDE